MTPGTPRACPFRLGESGKSLPLEDAPVYRIAAGLPTFETYIGGIGVVTDPGK